MMKEAGVAALAVVLCLLAGAAVWGARSWTRRRMWLPAAVVESLDDAVFVVNERGGVIELNPQAALLAAAVAPGSLPFLEPVSEGGFVVPVEGRDVQLDVTLTDLQLMSRDLGRAVIVRDVTAPHRVQRELVEVRTELEHQVETADRLRTQLVEQTLRDALTGLPNRRHLERTLAGQLAHSDETGESLAVVIVGVDHLRSVTELYGHGVADDLMVAMSRFLREQVRPEDELARFGGEEFVAVLNGCDAFDAYSRVQTWIDESASVGVRNAHVRVTRSISAGIALYPSSGSDPEEVLAAAELALGAARAAGRQRVKLAEPSSNHLQGWRRIPRHRAP